MATVTLGTLSAFAVTCLVIELTPGPNMAYLAILSATKGRPLGLQRRSASRSACQSSVSRPSSEFTALIANSRMLYEILRWGGVVYLLWLAYEGWYGEEDITRHSRNRSTNSKYFLRGLVTNLLNPKAGIFYIAVLPTFVTETRPVIGQAILLSLIYVTIATLVHSTVVLLANVARPWLEDERRSTVVRRALSLLLVGIAVWPFVTTRQIEP